MSVLINGMVVINAICEVLKMDVQLYREVGQTNQIIQNVVKIEDANNVITITDVFGRQYTVLNTTYYEIVGTPHY